MVLERGVETSFHMPTHDPTAKELTLAGYLMYADGQLIVRLESLETMLKYWHTHSLGRTHLATSTARIATESSVT